MAHSILRLSIIKLHFNSLCFLYHSYCKEMFAIHVLVSSIFYSCGTCHTHTCKVCMYFIIPTAFFVCLCMCSLFSLSLSGFQSSDDGRMGFLWDISPKAHRETKGAVTLLFLNSPCLHSNMYVRACVLTLVEGSCMHVWTPLRVCWGCHLFPALCASRVSGRAFDLVDRRFLQCEIALTRFTQWKSTP